MHRVGVGRRVAVVAGCRSPFCKAGTTFKDIAAVDLARQTVVEVLHRANLTGAEVDELYVGQVLSTPLIPNVAREVALLPQFAPGVAAATVNRACASGGAAVGFAHDQIALGRANVVIAGGVESLSTVPVLHSQKLSELVVGLGRAKTPAARLKLVSRFRPRDLVPRTPAIGEPSTGETMGEAAERMAKLNGISRAAQDEYALRSHRLAHAGTEDGRLLDEIAPLFLPESGHPVERDNGVRPDASLAQLGALRPVFDPRHGSVTAGNASPLTDGAAAVVLMSDEAARTLGYEPLAFVRSYAVAALDPRNQLLMGPGLAIPRALDQAGIAWSDLGLVEMHEAFAAQVLSNLNALGSREWAERHLGRSEPVGEVDWSTLNVMGGSIALGHPFGATGARLTLTLAHEMRRRGVQFGLVSICAQGGMGFAMVLERE